MNYTSGTIFAAAALVLAACDDVTTAKVSAPTRGGGSPAETACIGAVNANHSGRTATVVGSGSSGAGTVVMLQSGDGTNWRCVASDAGVVEELSVT